MYIRTCASIYGSNLANNEKRVSVWHIFIAALENRAVKNSKNYNIEKLDCNNNRGGKSLIIKYIYIQIVKLITPKIKSTFDAIRCKIVTVKKG